MSSTSGARGGNALPTLAVAACLLATAIAGCDIDRPGLYYDEVIQAEPSLRFLRADPEPLAMPGGSQVRWLGRWFPVMTQPYMGALKSQLLIAPFALFGPGPATLRWTTLFWSAAGLVSLFLWARRDLGQAAGALAVALVALDPSFLFVSRHDWGSFSLGFLCRCSALYLASTGWRAGRDDTGGVARLFGAGICIGLGVYNKIDFAVAVAGMGLALVAVYPRVLRGALGPARRRTGAAVVGAALGATPLLLSLGTALETARQALGRGSPPGDLAEKWHSLAALLDGSYFHRLMLAGGSFETMFETEPAASVFPWLLALSAVVVATALLRRRGGGGTDRAIAFSLLATALVPALTLLTPRTVRIHHALLVAPFPQLVVAIAATELWRAGGVARGAATRLARGAAVVLVAAALVGSARVDLLTLQTIRTTGGKGRWSDSIGALAAQLHGATVVSLDWGLYLPLHFADRDIAALEPIWKIRAQTRLGQPWTFVGSADTVYLAFEGKYAVFGYGEQLLDAVRELPARLVSVRRFDDRAGDATFTAIRFAGPHRLVYGGSFEVSVSDPAKTAAPRAR